MNGFGLEFYIETPANEVAETIHDVKKSWQFQLLYTVSQLAAGTTSSSREWASSLCRLSLDSSITRTYVYCYLKLGCAQ